MIRRPPRSTLFPYTALPICRRAGAARAFAGRKRAVAHRRSHRRGQIQAAGERREQCVLSQDRKSTRLNSSHRCISYAVFCLKKKKIKSTTYLVTKAKTSITYHLCLLCYTIVSLHIYVYFFF